MILLYGAGGEPGRGGIPMSPIRNRTFDVSQVCGVQGKIAHQSKNKTIKIERRKDSGPL